MDDSKAEERKNFMKRKLKFSMYSLCCCETLISFMIDIIVLHINSELTSYL